VEPIGPLIMVLAVLGGIGAALFGILSEPRVKRARRKKEFLERARDKLGMQIGQVADSSKGRVLVDAADDLKVRFRHYGETEWEFPNGSADVQDSTPIVEIQSPRGIASMLTIRPETFGFTKRLEKLLDGCDIRTGDGDFDSLFWIGGTIAPCVAVLDQETRAWLMRFSGERHADPAWRIARWSIEDGVLRFQWALPWEDTPEQAADFLKNVVDGYRHLFRPGSAVEHLIHNLDADKDARVRLRNLELLLQQPPEVAITEAVRRATRDPDPTVRLTAAEQLSDEVFDVLSEIALNHPQLSARAVRSLGKLGSPSVASVLVKVLESDPPPLSETLRAAAEALEAAPSPAAIPALVTALETADESVRIAVIRAIGASGGVSEVALLHPMTEAGNSSGIRRAALAAIRSIQSRLGDVEKGWLSVSAASADEGALSLSEGPPGALSVTGDESPE